MDPQDIYTAFFTAAQKYNTAVTPYAFHFLSLLILLEAISIGVVFLMDGEDAAGMVGRLGRMVLMWGFAFWWIENAWTLGLTVLGSFNQLGSSITGVPSLAPMAILHNAYDIAWMLWSAPSSSRMIPDIAAALGEIAVAVLIYVIFLLIAALAIFVLTSAYLLLGGGTIIVPMMVSRWLAPLAEGYFNWLMRTGILLFFLYLVLGIAVTLVAQWRDNLLTVCAPAGMWLPSPFLGTAPALSPAISCTATIPTRTLLTLLADTVILAFICVGVPFAAASMVSHGTSMALEHLAAVKYLAGGALRSAVGMAQSGGKAAYQYATSNSTLNQRMVAGAAAAAATNPSAARASGQGTGGGAANGGGGSAGARTSAAGAGTGGAGAPGAGSQAATAPLNNPSAGNGGTGGSIGWNGSSGGPSSGQGNPSNSGPGGAGSAGGGGGTTGASGSAGAGSSRAGASSQTSTGPLSSPGTRTRNIAIDITDLQNRPRG